MTEETVNTTETLARSSGWVPLEEWEEQGRDADEWVDAKTFNMRGEFFDKIHNQKREISDLRATVEDLKKLNTKVAEQERKKLEADLKKTKVKAMEEEDYDSVVEIDEKLAELRATKSEEVNQPDVEQFQRDFDSWKKDNKWYDEDSDLQVYADGLGTKIANEARGSKSWNTIFKEVEERVKKAFPHKFENPERDKQTAVSTNNRSKSGTNKKQKFTISDLDENQQRIAKRFERNGVMSVEDYIKELVKIGEL